MKWEAILMLTYWGIGVIGLVFMVDKPRKPVTPGAAAVAMLITLGQALLVLRLAA